MLMSVWGFWGHGCQRTDATGSAEFMCEALRKRLQSHLSTGRLVLEEGTQSDLHIMKTLEATALTPSSSVIHELKRHKSA